MIGKKINQLATELSPATDDLTIIGDPVTGVSKKITLLQIANLFATTGTVSSVAVTETGNALTITGSPITSAGTINIGFAGAAAQYVRGDGTLADFPTFTGGGSSVSYYLNSSVSQGTIGGVAYRELSKNPIFGTGTDISISADGYIASYLTDAGDPAFLNIPGGNWNFETYFSASSGGGTPSFYVELYKYDGTTFTLISSSVSVPEDISFGTSIQPYFSTLAVPETVLAVTDRLAVRYYVNTSGRTITLHTEDNHLCQVITTFSTGITALNGLKEQVQYFATGTSGTDFNIVSATAIHTFNLPTASAINRGALSSADWTTFNNKQNALTNPITGTGTSGQVAYFNGTNSITSESNLFWDSTNDRLGIGTSSPLSQYHQLSSIDINVRYQSTKITSSYVVQLYLSSIYNATSGFTRDNAPFETGLYTQGTSPNTIDGFYIGRTGLNKNDFLLNKDGNIGIGVNSITSGIKFDVNGNGRFLNDVSFPQLILGRNSTRYFGMTWDDAAGEGILQTYSNIFAITLQGTYLKFITSGTTRMRIFETSGNVLIQNGGTFTDAGFRLDVNGTARVVGNLTTSLTTFGSVAQAFTFGGEAVYGTVGSQGTIFLQGGLVKVGNQNNVVVSGAALGTAANALLIQGTHTSSSATIQTDLGINTTLNFASSGYTYRGIWYNPTITSLGGNRHIAVETATGDVLLCTTSGNVAIGTSTLATATELTLGGSQTASSGIARGGLINTTLVAAANNDVLVGLDINPTFTNGAFTSVTNAALRVGPVSNAYISSSNASRFGFTTDALTFGSNGFNISTNAAGSIQRPNNASRMVLGTANIAGLQPGYLFALDSFQKDAGLIYDRNSSWIALVNGTASDNSTTYTPRLTVQQNGNIGINTTTDAGFRLDVNGTARVQDRLTIVKNEAGTFDGVSIQNTNTGHTTVFRAKDNTTGVCEFGLGNTSSPFPNDAFFYTNKSNLDFYANADRKLRIFGTTGNIQIQNGGTFTDVASSILTLNSTSKGFLVSRMTSAQRVAIASPATGLLVYQTDGTEGFYVYSGGSWKSLTMV
jgi:hypothetical protein